MAVYDGVPSIRLEGDRGRALALIPEAKALLYKVQTFLQRAEIETFSMSRRVDDDSYIYVLSSGGQNLLHISVAPAAVDSEYPTPDIPEGESTLTMLSGMVVRGFQEEVPVAEGDTPYLQLGTFYPTTNCQRVNGLPPGGQPSRRLTVSPHSSMEELNNPMEPPVYSQYTKLRPTMYSGGMQKVVQAVMGLGRLPPGVLRAMKNSGVSASYIDSLRNYGAQVQYDYKHQRTHGVTLSSDGTPWLVEISITRGVLAMPLPLYPGSDSPEFIEAFRARGDEDIATIAELLGGIPTGESFPRDSQTLNARLERGDILRLLPPTELAEFYSASPYSSCLGWAFSPDGREAHNTGYYYHEDGYQRGVWWQINIQIGALNPDWVPGEGPIAAATAAAIKMGEGFLYSERNVPPTNPRAYLPFKVHQPNFGLMSHSAQPIGPLPPPLCDTVVHVCFINGDFHAVKFYRNPKEDNYDEVEDDRYPGECLYNGQWQVTERRGNRSFPPMMYSNREDPRRVQHEYLSTTKIVSTDLGFGPPQYGDLVLYPQYAFVFRNRYFKYVSETTTQQGEHIVCAVSTPEFVREGYYMAYGEYMASESTSRVVRYDSLMDPNQGYSWRCLSGFGGGGLPGVPDLNPLICGGNCSPFPSGPHVHPDRRIVYTFYNGGGCADMADGGPWLDMCMSVEGFGPPPSYPPAVVTNTPPTPKSSGWLKLFMTGVGGSKTMPFSYERAWEWWRPSPDPESGEVHKISAYYNAIGSDAICYMTDYLTYGTRRTEGFFISAVTPSDPIPCFIGVYKP